MPNYENLVNKRRVRIGNEMDPVAAISLTFSIAFFFQCLYSCNLYHNLNRVYDRLDTIEQIVWSNRQQTTNPVYTVATRECNHVEDPE